MNHVYVRLREAIEFAPREAMPELRKAIGLGYTEGFLNEAQNDELWNLSAICEHRPAPERRKARDGSRPRSPDSMRRRRQFMGSGHLPPSIRPHFTAGEQSVLNFVAVEVKRSGTCKLKIGAIAGATGLGETTVKKALGRAAALGFIWIERRSAGRKRNDPNVIRIIAPEWVSWLNLGRKGLRESAMAIIAITNQGSSATPTKTRDLPGEASAKRHPGTFGGPSSSGAWRPYF